MTKEEWGSIWDYAQVLKANGGNPAAAGGIIGRSITYLVDKLAEFWAKHQNTLIPVLSDLAIAALQAIVAARSDISVVNFEGPQ